MFVRIPGESRKHAELRLPLKASKTSLQWGQIGLAKIASYNDENSCVVSFELERCHLNLLTLLTIVYDGNEKAQLPALNYALPKEDYLKSDVFDPYQTDQKYVNLTFAVFLLIKCDEKIARRAEKMTLFRSYVRFATAKMSFFVKFSAGSHGCSRSYDSLLD